MLPASHMPVEKQKVSRRTNDKGARDPEGPKSSAKGKQTRKVTPVNDGTTDEEKEICSKADMEEQVSVKGRLADAATCTVRRRRRLTGMPVVMRILTAASIM